MLLFMTDKFTVLVGFRVKPRGAVCIGKMITYFVVRLAWYLICGVFSFGGRPTSSFLRSSEQLVLKFYLYFALVFLFFKLAAVKSCR